MKERIFDILREVLAHELYAYYDIDPDENEDAQNTYSNFVDDVIIDIEDNLD